MMDQKFENFYGRRQGKKLRPQRVKLVEEVLPELSISLTPSLTLPRRREREEWQDVWLEVGFGAGEHLAWQAEANPDVLMIGAEPYINGVAKLLDHVEKMGLENVRVFPNDVRPLLDALPDQSLGRVFVLFNDPWPKKRHWARRFIVKSNLDRLARIMKPGAELRLATDDKSLLFWMIDHMRADNRFVWKIDRCHGWLTRSADWPPTRYELKAIRGRPYFLKFVRV